MSLQHDLTERSRTNELVVAAAVMAAVTACLFLKLTRHPGDLLVGVHSAGQNDVTGHFLRSRDTPLVLQDRFGEWSNWDPYLALGLPVHGNPQAGLLYPPNWLALLLGAKQTLSWLMVAQKSIVNTENGWKDLDRKGNLQELKKCKKKDS